MHRELLPSTLQMIDHFRTKSDGVVPASQTLFTSEFFNVVFKMAITLGCMCGMFLEHVVAQEYNPINRFPLVDQGKVSSQFLKFVLEASKIDFVRLTRVYVSK